MCFAHLNDKMHLEGVRGLIRSKLIELPAMQNMEKSGRFSIKGDKEISYRKDDAELLDYKCQLKSVLAPVSQIALTYWNMLNHLTPARFVMMRADENDEQDDVFA